MADAPKPCKRENELIEEGIIAIKESEDKIMFGEFEPEITIFARIVRTHTQAPECAGLKMNRKKGDSEGEIIGNELEF